MNSFRVSLKKLGKNGEAGKTKQRHVDANHACGIVLGAVAATAG